MVLPLETYPYRRAHGGEDAPTESSNRTPSDLLDPFWALKTLLLVRSTTGDEQPAR